MADTPAKSDTTVDTKPAAKPGTPATAGEPTDTEDVKSVGRTANDYMIPMSDSAKADWRGKEAAFVAHAQQVAGGLYPTLAPQIAQGITTKTLVDPYVQVAKSLLGKDTEPDFTDPKWSPALEGGTDPVTQRPTLMPLSQWRQYLMEDPQHGYDMTPDAHAKALEFVNGLRQQFTGRPSG
jgi:hypothetical protein